jgi:hypothetical protein
LDTTLILLGSGCLVCLMPLAIYLLYLSYLNGRTPPTIVSGPWDLAAVLLGLSGFILLLGPLVITLLDSTWRGYAFGGWATLRTVGREEAMAGSIMAAGYFVILLGLILMCLNFRRRVTAIYNVAPESVETALVGVVEHLGYPWRQIRGEVEINLKKPTDLTGPASRFYPHEVASVRISSFPATGHATLKWDGDWTDVRPEIEGVLPAALTSYAGSRNPVSGWMFTAALAVMIVMLLWLVVMIYLIMSPATH